jgi:hypothetical protein
VKKLIRNSIGAVTIAGAIAGGALLTAPLAGALAPGTYFLPNENACYGAQDRMERSGFTITQRCTYSGPMFLGWRTADGPWLFVAK